MTTSLEHDLPIRIFAEHPEDPPLTIVTESQGHIDADRAREVRRWRSDRAGRVRCSSGRREPRAEVADLETLAGLDRSPGALDIAISWVLDSSGLWDEPAATAIGIFLRDEKEAALVSVVVRLLDETPARRTETRRGAPRSVETSARP